MSDHPPLWMRLLLSAVVCVHLTAMAGSSLRETVPGAALREFTRPYEQSMGVHQTWPMFVGVPRATKRLRFVGKLDDRTELPLPQLTPPFDPDQTLWRYSRRNKLERNALADKRKYLRGSFVRHYCRSLKDQGHDVAQIWVERITILTPPHGTGPPNRKRWPVKRKVIDHWNCR